MKNKTTDIIMNDSISKVREKANSKLLSELVKLSEIGDNHVFNTFVIKLLENVNIFN